MNPPTLLTTLVFSLAIIASVIVLGMLAVVAAVAVSRAVESLRNGSFYRRFRDDWDRLRGRTPWLPRMRQMSLLGSTHGQHTTAFVSRHHLAEGGLNCPLCEARVADAGDFSQVYRTIVDGRENECIICPGEREIGDRMVPCATILLASPDTEHGDHLNDAGVVDPNGADPPEYYRFRRCSADQALREKWGVEVKDDGRGDIVTAGPAPKSATADADTALLPAIKE